MDEVAEAIGRLIEGGKRTGSTYEFGGPHIYTYKALVQEIARQLDLRVNLIPMPFAMWSALARMAELLPGAPLTRNQIDLMRRDNVANPDLPGLEELGIQSQDLNEVIHAVGHDPNRSGA